MKKYKKIIVAFLGAVNTGFSIFIPVGLTLLLVPYLTKPVAILLWSIGILSSLYRAIDIGFLR